MNTDTSLFSRGSLIALILVAGLLLRIAFIILHQRPLISDEREYHQLALNLIEIGTYAIDGEPTAYRPVGYPALVAAIYSVTGATPLTVKLAQALLDVGTAFLLFLLVPSTDVRRRILVVTVWSLYVPAILYTNFLLSETIFTCALVLFVYLIARAQLRSVFSSVVTGAILAILVLIKPSIALLAILLLPSCGKAKLPLHRIALMLLCAAILLLPWLMRNHRTLGTFVLTTNAGINLLIGNNPDATGAYTAHIADSIFHRSLAEPQRDSVAMQLAFGYIVAHPDRFLLNGVKKLAHLFTSEGGLLVWSFHPNPESRDERFANKYAAIPWPLIVLTNLPYMLVLLAGIIGFLSSPRETLWYILAAILLTWLLVHFLFFGGSRFHFPLMPFFTLYASTLVWKDRTPLIGLTHTARLLVFFTVVLLIALWATEFLVLFQAGYR